MVFKVKIRIIYSQIKRLILKIVQLLWKIIKVIFKLIMEEERIDIKVLWLT